MRRAHIGAARITGVTIDSRTVAAGDLFVALPGSRTDGARFAADALRAGAAAVLVAGTPGDAGADAQSIVVADPLIALGQIAAEVRRRSARARGRRHRLDGEDLDEGHPGGRSCGGACARSQAIANFNTEIGLPLTLCRVDADTEAVVCELGMRGLGQVAYLAEIARPDVAVITSVGPVHLELVGTVEAVAEAKAEILQPLGPAQTAVVPARRAAARAVSRDVPRARDHVRRGRRRRRAPGRLRAPAGRRSRSAVERSRCR